MTWEQLYRHEWAGLVARLIRVTGDWSLAEDCVQEAFARAWKAWGTGPRPDRPGAWLYTAARNVALDRWRRSKVEAGKVRLLEAEPEAEPVQDDRLALMFTCCHPSLALEGQVALTLKAVGGLTTAALARAFLVTEDTMARRLTRARTKIETAGVPLAVPDQPFRPERLAGVLGVLYLLFNQGNDAALHETDRAFLADEAIELTRLLAELVPDEAEAAGCLALLLLTRSRRPARFDEYGRPVTLDLQDRTRWDAVLKREGLDELSRALAGPPGPYTLQAAIAGCHARAETAADTDFAQIAGLYRRLEALTPTPVVRLNRAVAVGLAQGPGAALVLLNDLASEPALARYPWLPAARADALVRLQHWPEAAVAWGQAADLAEPTEKEFFARKQREAETHFP